jgi:hypothetical protein
MYSIGSSRPARSLGAMCQVELAPLPSVLNFARRERHFGPSLKLHEETSSFFARCRSDV